jgi:hypothetical protein
MNSRDRECDDLTEISGIAAKRQQLLRQSLDVRTYSDLVNLPVEEIEKAFKAKGWVITRNEIEQWQEKARELATKANLSPPQVKEVAGAAGAEQNFVPARDGEWEPFASFVVEFETRQVDDHEEKRTTVHYVEKDTGDTWEGPNWPGLVSDQPCLWMLDQLEEKPQLQPSSAEALLIEPSPVEAPPAEARPLPVEVIQIRAFQPPEVEKPTGIGEANQSFAGLLSGQEPFALEVDFALSEQAAADMAERSITYNARFYVRNLATGTSTPLGDTDTAALVGGARSYTALLSKASLQTGIYRLGVLVKLRSSPPSVNYLEVPLLQVV